MPPGYTSLPGEQSFVRKKTFITVNDVSVPVVPAVCCLLFLAGLPMWAAGMLQARSTTDAIFADLGVEHESLDRLKASVLAAVLVLTPVIAAMAGVNAWLEVSRSTRPGGLPGTGLALSSFTSACSRINAGNWLRLLLVLTLSLAGTCTWLADMSAALSSAGGKDSGGSGPPWPPAPAAAEVTPTSVTAVGSTMEAAASTPSFAQQLQGLLQQVPAAQQGAWHSAMVQLLAGQQAQEAAAAQAPSAAAAAATAGLVGVCPPPCIDLGVIAAVLGLPWPCFCQLWMLPDLQAHLSQVVTELSVAMVGAVLLWVCWSWLFGYLAAQGAHAERDLRDLLEPAAAGAAGVTPTSRLAAA